MSRGSAVATAVIGPAALLHLVGHEMRHHLGVGLGRELGAAGFELGAQFGEILDDAVVDDRDLVGRMGMGIDLVGTAMGRPAGMADADGARQRLLGEPDLEIAQLAFGAAAGQVAGLQRRDPGQVIAAVFQPLQGIDHARRDRLAAEDSDDSAHQAYPLVRRPLAPVTSPSLSGNDEKTVMNSKVIAVSCTI